MGNRKFISLVIASALIAGASLVSYAAPNQGGATAPPAQAVAPDQKPTILGVNDPRNPLHLTTNQQNSLFSKTQKANGEFMAIVNDKALSDTQKQQKVNALKISFQSDIRTVLTPAQQAAQNARTAARAKQFASINKQYTAVVTQLKASITPTQKDKLTALTNQAEAQVTKIQGDASLSVSDKQQKMSALRSWLASSSLAIYTPSQQKLLGKLASIKSQAAGG